MKTKHLTAILLTAAVILTVSCKNNVTENEPIPSSTPTPDLPQTISLENYYASEKLGIDFEASGYKYDYANGRIYYSKTKEIRNMESRGELIGRNVEIFSCDTSGGGEQSRWWFSLSVTGEGETGSYQTPLHFGADESGNLWVTIELVEYDAETETTTCQLVKSGVDGSDFVVELPEIESIGAVPLGLLFDGDGNVYIETSIASGRALFVYSGSTGEYLFDTRNDTQYRSAATSSDGNVVYVRMGDGGYEFVTLATTGIVSVSPGFRSILSGSIYNGVGDYSIFYNDDDAVYGLDLQSMESTPVISLTNSDIRARELGGLHCLSNTEFLIARNVKASSIETGIYKLTYDPDARADEKINLTLASIGYNPGISEIIQIFNSRSQTSRIELVGYAAEDYTQFDLDILSDNSADIVCLNNIISSPDKYISKGVFADLTEHLENDITINRDDLFPNILELGSKDGSLYHIITDFGVSTLVGKSAIFGDRDGEMTVEKLFEAAARYPDAEIVAEYSGEDWVNSCLINLHDDFIDWKNSTCSFDDEQFILMLKSLELFSDIDTSIPGFGTEAYYTELIIRFRNDKALLLTTTISGARDVRAITEGFGEAVSFVGFPSRKGGSHSVMALRDFAIMESSVHKDEAWEFISMFLRKNTEMPKAGISINRCVIEAETKSEMVPFIERDFSNGLLVFRPMGYAFAVRSPEDVDLDKYANYHITEEEAARTLAIIESATKYRGRERSIRIIVSEELGPFLAGERTAEDTAAVIQSRASIYVAESAG